MMFLVGLLSKLDYGNTGLSGVSFELLKVLQNHAGKNIDLAKHLLKSLQ